MSNRREIDETVLEEGCYYLSQLGLSPSQIAERFETSREHVESLVGSYASKLKSGKVVPAQFDRTFWEDVKKEAEGDVKVTFVSEKGVHHGWRSDLRRMDGPSLMSIFEASKDFMNMDPNQRFLDYPAPKGYDPLALEREVKSAIEVLGGLLDDKWKEEDAKKTERKGRKDKARNPAKTPG